MTEQEIMNEIETIRTLLNQLEIGIKEHVDNKDKYGLLEDTKLGVILKVLDSHKSNQNYFQFTAWLLYNNNSDIRSIMSENTYFNLLNELCDGGILLPYFKSKDINRKQLKYLYRGN